MNKTFTDGGFMKRCVIGLVVFASFVVILGMGCEKEKSKVPITCDDRIAEMENLYGMNYEVDYFSTSDGYRSRDYWYWSKGLCFSFQWGTNISGCKWSIYEFTPIYKTVSEETKDLLIENRIESDSGCDCYESNNPVK